MVQEAVQQFKDYYEDDAEEAGFFEYLENLSNRDQIRFMEIFEDFTVDKGDLKKYVMIDKREYNPELSVLSNMVLDLVDFKDRVRPLSQDIAMLEEARKYQKDSAFNVLDRDARIQRVSDEINGKAPEEKIEASQPEGYSSIEAPATEAEEEAAAPEEDAAEPEEVVEEKKEE